MVWQLQSSDTKEKYDMHLNLLEIELGVLSRSTCKGSILTVGVFADIGNTALDGWRTSNFLESVFGTQAVMGVRGMNPYAFIETMCSRLVCECYTRSTNFAQ